MAYMDINGHATWIDDRGGDGEPVLLLHGGLSDSDPMFDVFAASLSDFHLLAFDRRGHGRSADSPEPFSYLTMADETLAVLNSAVAGRTAHLVGWSDGANIAMIFALRHPELVKSIVLIGGNYSPDGMMPPAASTGEHGASDDVDTLAIVRAAYAERSPDGGDHFDEVIAKSFAMWAVEPTLNIADLEQIHQPALVLVGDDDVMTLAHTCSLYEALPAGQLCVVPGTSHFVAVEKPELVAHVVAVFLRDQAPPKTFMPMRRRR
jgi:pimeloyl-ACP methyl ester carboxylesterase